MQSINEETETSHIDNPESIGAKQFLITQENYQLLKQCQKEIFDATETSPAIRKIINALINEENLNKIKTRFINVWSE